MGMIDHMTIGNAAPRGFDDWLHTLHRKGIGKAFQVQTASWLRVIAGTRNGAVFLVTGTEAVPYANWLQDGMTMNSRLILHNQSKQVTQSIQSHFATDIRVATHAQDLAVFLSDIEEHKFDFVIMDVDDVDSDLIPIVLERLAECGLLIGIGTDSRLNDLVQACGDGYFFSRTGKSLGSAILSRKSIQHRAVRRGGRRRHSQVI